MSDTQPGSQPSSSATPPSSRPAPSAPPPGMPGSAPEAVLVEGNRPCIKCSYNLVNLPVTGVCPECGSMVSDSLKGILLQFASPEYLKTIGSGLSLVLNGILLSIVIGVGGVIASFAFGMGGAGGGAMRTIQLIMMVLTQVTSVMILLGYWRFTEPDPGFVGLNYPSQARQLVRAAVGVQAVVQLISFVNSFFVPVSPLAPGGGFTVAAVIALLVGLVSVVCWVVQFFSVMLYTRWIAGRIPDTFVIGRANRYLWLLPVLQTVGLLLIGLGPLIALIMYWNLLNRVRNHIKSIVATGTPTGKLA